MASALRRFLLIAASCALALRPPANGVGSPRSGSPSTSVAAKTRRAAIGSFAAAAFSLTPLASHAATAFGETGSVEGGALGATCLGFGCNPYGDLGFNGMPADQAPPGSMPYPKFLEAIKAKTVEGVVFEPPMGDVAYAIIDGKSIRIGEGWPVEVSNSWSSPTWVVRILENEGVPYAWNFDLKAKPSYQKKMQQAKQGGYAANQFKPSKKKVSALDTTNANGEGFTAQPRMYGGAETAMDSSLDDPDYAGNFK